MLPLVLLIIVVFVLGFSLVRYVAFLLSNLKAGQLNEIRRGVGSLDKALGRAFMTAVLADCIVIPASLLLLLPERAAQGTGTPVVLVHGLFHNRSAWWLFKYRLKRAGITNVHTYQYNSFTRGFDEAVQGLEQKLGSVIGNDPNGRVILVGHSLGGLVCRAVAGKSVWRDHIEALVALGSPHKGSELAWFGGNRMSRGLIPGKYISQQIERTPDPDCPKLAIYTLTDDYVMPLDMLRPGRKGWHEMICSPLAHVWMLYDGEVADGAIEFMKTAKAGKP